MKKQLRTQTAADAPEAPQNYRQTIQQWFAYQDRVEREMFALNMQIENLQAQRDELLVAAKETVEWMRNEMDEAQEMDHEWNAHDANCVLCGLIAAIAKAERGSK